MKNEKATSAFFDAINEMNARIDEIKAYLDNHMGTNPDSLNWGDVGSARDMLTALTELTDRAYKRGEYAE